MANARKPSEAVKPQGTRSRASAKKRIEQVAAADTRAARRYRIARFAKATGGSLRSQRSAVCSAVEAGELPGPVPSLSALHDWVRTLEKESAGERDFADRPRAGRPRKDVHPDVHAFVVEKIATEENLSTRRLGKLADVFAQQNGLPKPGRHAIRRLIEEKDPAEIAALRHGARSAILDGMVSGGIPSSWPHEVWSLDEGTLPIYIRVWDALAKSWRVVKPDVVMIIDHHSRVLVGWHIANPGRRGKTSGFDRDDIMAALWSAAIPELAPGSTQDFAGYLPRVLRWDRAPVHRPLARLLNGHGVEVPDLPGNMPKSRGRIERPIKTIKPLCSEIKGYDARWQVAETTKKDPRATRTTAAASRERATAKMLVSAEDLLTYDELVTAFDAVVRGYQYQDVHVRLGTQPVNRYYETLNKKEVRAGRDILSWVEPVYNVVTKEGLVHRGVEFAPEVDREPFRLGARMEFRPDPLLRGIFVEHRGYSAFVPTKQEWSRTNDPQGFAEAQQKRAREYSDLGHALREKHRFELLGPEGIARADEAAKVAIQQAGKDEYQRQKEKEERESRSKPAPAKSAPARHVERTQAERLAERTIRRPPGIGVIADPRQLIRVVK